MTRNLRRLSRPEAIVFVWALAFVFAAFAAIPAAHAGIVSFSGVTPLGGPPAPGVHPGDQPPVPTPIIFPEFLNGVIPVGGVKVDHDGSVVVASPVETGNVVNPLLVSGVIPAGTRVDSYLFHFDPLDVAFPTAANFYPLSSIVFSNKIIGVQLFSSGYTALQKPVLTPYVGGLESGDGAPVFNGGPTPAYYPGGLAFRGMEEDAMAITSGGFGINLW